MSEIPTREEYDHMIEMADAAFAEATAEHNRARDAERRADAQEDKDWRNLCASYPIKSPTMVNKERLGQLQTKLEEHVRSGGNPRDFLGERKPEPASAFDAQRIYSKGGNVNHGRGLQRFGGFGVEHRGRTVVPSEK